MKSRADGYTPNQRMFSGGIRGRLHFARFRWFTNEILDRQIQYDSVLEIGCFDGKLIGFFPTLPVRYAGYDKNWEGGLDLAIEKWKAYPGFSFYNVNGPEDMVLSDTERFDITVSMETFEHLSADLADGYLNKAAKHTDGYIFVTVPNEKGVVLLAKWLVKKLLSKDSEPYTFSEIVNATLGRMHLVERREHKGFDYLSTIKEIGRHFEIVKITGLPFEFLPLSLSFQIGILAKAKPR